MASVDSNSILDGCLVNLKPSTVDKLSQLLNPKKIIHSPQGQLRDWRGLAEFLGCGMLQVQNLERPGMNPFKELLKIGGKDLTVNRFVEFLEKMDRYDVVDDTIALMENDLYELSVQATSVMNSTSINTSQILTVDDYDYQHLNETYYDAFVLYAREDQEFIDQIVEKMEGEYGLKLCLKDRDLMPGMPFEHKVVTDLISNRCRFVLPIFSPNFLNSEDEYGLNFAEALAIEKGCRKIIPCIYQTCTLPKSLAFYTRLDYTRTNPYWDFWDKMRKSIADPSVKISEKPKENKGSESLASVVKLPEKKLLVGEVSSFTEKQSIKDPVEPAAPSSTPNSYQEMLSESSLSTTEPKSRWFEKINKKFKKKSSSKQKVKATAF